tara:strand:- start:105 stop:1289 length:1185 start_codon:yes stop_codon:yes gene_type:complete
VIILACAGLILFISIGTRQIFGLFLTPMEADLGWGRETFGFAIAMQNLVWGLSQPFVGALADRFGSARVIAMGAVVYILGLIGMASTSSAIMFNLSGGLLVGLALSGTGFAVVLGGVARFVHPSRRGFAFSIVGTTGALGQLAMIPITHGAINGFGWIGAFFILAATASLIVPLAAALRFRTDENEVEQTSEQTFREALTEARGHKGYWLLNAGFFVCGFHIAFILTHLPAYISDEGFSADMGAMILIVIGVFNIPSALLFGKLSDHMQKRMVLSIMYLARAAIMTMLVFFPTTQTSLLIFGAVMGLLWLATIPITNAIVAQVFGVKYVATLFGITWGVHQVGSFFGAWMGGLIFDMLGSYDLVWWFSAWMGITAALLHWPIDERALPRLVTAE